MTDQQTENFSETCQIIDVNGAAYQAAVRNPLWVTDRPFAQPHLGNDLKHYLYGKDYFADLIKDFESAESSIYIAGWWVSWDALMVPRGGRLYDALRDVVSANPGVNVYVMPWCGSLATDTSPKETKYALESINDSLNCNPPRVHVLLAASVAPVDTMFYSHHQKQVVVDRKIGYIGGMDLCYGRYEEPGFTLHANAAGREAGNRYSNCVSAAGSASDDGAKLVNLDVLGLNHSSTQKFYADEARRMIESGAWQKPSGGSTLNPHTQPRQPWNDVEARIAGPAVADLARNFVSRWNQTVSDKKLRLTDVEKPAEGSGKCQVQVLRSAPARMCDDNETQNDHLKAMRLLIEKSTNFIYIENQFFSSYFGAEQGSWNPGVPLPPKQQGPGAKIYSYFTQHATTLTFSEGDGRIDNDICACLGRRIGRAIWDCHGEPFHVYITLPVHPEGRLNDPIIATQVHLTMQTLVFGELSLLNRIRRHLWCKREFDRQKSEHQTGPELVALKKQLEELSDNQYGEIRIDQCFDYVTLLNLRNWAQLDDGRYVTEQVYVHSKLIIVDDRFALLGSANINDRSLMGDRDSELGVMVLDTEQDHEDVLGDGMPRLVRRFAHELRLDVWKRMFGLDMLKCVKDGVLPAVELETAIKQPGKRESWQAIQKLASNNASHYEAVFPFVPRNWDSFDLRPNKVESLRLGASIWPTFDRSNTDSAAVKQAATHMPFDATFWKKPQFNSNPLGQLEQIRGFITALPYAWTKGENNNMGLNLMSVAVNDDVPSAGVPGKIFAYEDTEMNDLQGREG